MALIDESERRAIADAIRAAEQRTSAEIVCVLMHHVSDYRAIPLLWAALLALALPWPLIILTQLSAATIHFVQLAGFLVLGVALLLLPWRFHLVPRAVKRRYARRAAREQFHAQGLRRTAQRLGVLIFVAEAERYVEILVDDGVAAHVDDAVWRDAIAMLVEALQRREAADGILRAVAMVAEILAARLPRAQDDANELPDKIVVI